MPISLKANSITFIIICAILCRILSFIHSFILMLLLQINNHRRRGPCRHSDRSVEVTPRHEGPSRVMTDTTWPDSSVCPRYDKLLFYCCLNHNEWSVWSQVDTFCCWRTWRFGYMGSHLPLRSTLYDCHTNLIIGMSSFIKRVKKLGTWFAATCGNRGFFYEFQLSSNQDLIIAVYSILWWKLKQPWHEQTFGHLNKDFTKNWKLEGNLTQTKNLEEQSFLYNTWAAKYCLSRENDYWQKMSPNRKSLSSEMLPTSNKISYSINPSGIMKTLLSNWNWKYFCKIKVLQAFAHNSMPLTTTLYLLHQERDWKELLSHRWHSNRTTS